MRIKLQKRINDEFTTVNKFILPQIRYEGNFRIYVLEDGDFDVTAGNLEYDTFGEDDDYSHADYNVYDNGDVTIFKEDFFEFLNKAGISYNRGVINHGLNNLIDKIKEMTV